MGCPAAQSSPRARYPSGRAPRGTPFPQAGAEQSGTGGQGARELGLGLERGRAGGDSCFRRIPRAVDWRAQAPAGRAAKGARRGVATRGQVCEPSGGRGAVPAASSLLLAASSPFLAWPAEVAAGRDVLLLGRLAEAQCRRHCGDSAGRGS